MAACAVQEDKAMFPGCSDVVRVHMERWESCHDDVLERLLQKIGAFFEEHSGSFFFPKFVGNSSGTTFECELVINSRTCSTVLNHYP